MCGIVGLFSLNKIGFTQPQITMVEQMLFADQLRGQHGTGIFYNNRDGRGKAVRGAMPASAFLKDTAAIKGLEEAYHQATFVVGHNRWATRGAHTNENTHPFIEGPITLVHNGTINGHRALKDVEVDSHAICHSFAEKGAKETLKDLKGAFALVWYNSETKLLHFIRNDDRPLWIIKGVNVIAIASEYRMAEWIMSRNGEIVKETTPCVVGRMYTFDPKTRDITEEDIDLYKAPIFPYQGYYNGTQQQGYYETGQEKWRKAVSAAMTETEVDDAIVVTKEVSLPYDDPYAYGKTVVMTPIAIDNSGKGYKLTLIVQSGLNTPDIYASYYANSKEWMDTLMEANSVTGIITATRYKGSEVSIVVKTPEIVLPKEQQAVLLLAN